MSERFLEIVYFKQQFNSLRWKGGYFRNDLVFKLRKTEGKII